MQWLQQLPSCLWIADLEVADSELARVGEFHHGHQTAGEQPLYDAYLTTLCKERGRREGGRREKGDGGERELGGRYG